MTYYLYNQLRFINMISCSQCYISHYYGGHVQFNLIKLTGTKHKILWKTIVFKTKYTETLNIIEPDYLFLLMVYK